MTSSTHSGYVQLRRGLLEHMEHGRLNATEVGVFVYLLLRANRETWVVWATDEMLAADCGISRDHARRIRRKLLGLHYLEPVEHGPRKGRQPWFIPKADPQRALKGAVKGAREGSSDPLAETPQTTPQTTPQVTPLTRREKGEGRREKKNPPLCPPRGAPLLGPEPTAI